jgi:hypothetical protein
MRTCTFDVAVIAVAIFLRVAVSLASFTLNYLFFFVKGGSNFSSRFINRLILYISLLFDFCFKSTKNKHSGFFVILCPILLILVTS